MKKIRNLIYAINLRTYIKEIHFQQNINFKLFKNRNCPEQTNCYRRNFKSHNGIISKQKTPGSNSFIRKYYQNMKEQMI